MTCRSRLPKVLALLALAVVFIIPFFWRYVGLPLCFGVVTTDSMVPTIRPGDLVVGLAGEPSVGSVVVLESGSGRMVVHRVVYMNSTHVVTAGDACPCPGSADPPAQLGRVRCVVVAVVRHGWAILLLLSVASAACASLALRELRRCWLGSHSQSA